MTPEQYQHVKALFGAALELPVAERTAFLDAECGAAEPEVRCEVERLLVAADEARSFLSTPVATLSPPSRSALHEGHMLGRYRLCGLLGEGGMGAVYRANDLRLERQIALKLLPRSLSHDAERLRRFEQEARAASALSHPNVCVIYEVGETGEGDDARHYIAMEYVPGESLRQLLERHRAAGTRLGLAAALDIVQQAAAGLGAAHVAGVVHRDVKPENIMIRPDGLVKVLDFGLAKLARVNPPESHSSVSAGDTEPGMVLGTVHYMSPEQARGLPVDVRTDVWSLGVVLYELLAGRQPFEGATSSDIMVSVLERQPEPLETLSPAVPIALRDVVARSLEKDRELRYPSTDAMRRDLKKLARELGSDAAGGEALLTTAAAASPATDRSPRRILLFVSLALATVIGGAVAAWWQIREAPSHQSGNSARTTTTAAARLVVLPFENLGRNQDAYLADGIADEVRGKLAALRGLEVIARSSSNEYRRTNKSLQQVGRELGVRYVLSGTVRYESGAEGTPGRVLVSPELVELSSDRQPITRWQHAFEAALTGIFKVQADVATRVAEALDVELGTGAEARLATRPTANLAAYDAYLQGEETSNALASQEPATLKRAMRFYARAVMLDSAFARAWSRLAVAHATLYFNSAAAAASGSASRNASEHARALAPHDATTHLALGAYYQNVEANPSRAALEFAEGLRDEPNNVELLTAAAAPERSVGRWDLAIARLNRSAALDPRSVNTALQLGQALLYQRRYLEARREIDRIRLLAPDDLALLQLSSMVELAKGDVVGARAILRHAPANIDHTDLAAFMSAYWDLGWVLEEPQQRLALDASPDHFGGDRLSWAAAHAHIYLLRGDSVRARAFADTTKDVSEAMLRSAPGNDLIHISRGLALAMLGRKDEAVSEGRRAVAILPISKDAYGGTYTQHQLARIYILVGEHEKALDQLEPLLKIPYYLSPGWLRIDPTFAPLHGNPRFERLIAAR